MANNKNVWPMVPLGSIATIKSGGTPDRANPGFWDGGAIPWVTTSELNYSTILRTAERITLEGLANSSAKVFPAGTILIALYGQGKTRGQVGILGVDAATNQACAAIIPTEKLDRDYLYQYLVGAYNSIRALSNAGGQHNLSSQLVSEIPVSVPSRDAQRKIAAILRTWDEAIEASNGIARLLVQRRRAVGDRLLSQLTHGGKVVSLKDFLTESRIAGSDGRTARKITIRLYGKGAVERDESRTGSKNTRYYVRRQGQLIYSKLDFLNGAIAIVPDSLDGFETTLDLPAFDISPAVNPNWLLEYLVRPSFYASQVHLARGQRKALRVAPEDLLECRLRLPPRKQQDQFAQQIAATDHEIALNRKLLVAIGRQKRGLLQKLLTGEWKL